MRFFPILVAAGVMGATALPMSATPQGTDFQWSGRLDRGKAIEIKGINGAITARATTGAEVQVTAVKHAGAKGDVADVTFKVVEGANGVTICAVYPGTEGEPNECVQGSGGRMNVKENNTRVDFTVHVPAGVNFIGKTVNGDIETDRIGGNVHATTVNGDVSVAAAGYVRATTVNGSIEASLGRADWQGDLEFSTVNGGIALRLPDGVGAEVTAGTVNGSFETDFPLTVQGKWGPKHVTGTIGSGGRKLTLNTVNGNVSLRRGG
ncbi:MAG: DUF4097 family beta strand repeat protein [Gemmatimonadales bacterium]|nr:DUF4097 family beta strand repeat protein [Gemmatimonadales bacterium]